MRRLRLLVVGILVLLNVTVTACPVCNSPLGKNVRSTFVRSGVVKNSLMALLPFVVFAAAAGVMRRFTSN